MSEGARERERERGHRAALPHPTLFDALFSSSTTAASSAPLRPLETMNTSVSAGACGGDIASEGAVYDVLP